MKHNLIIGLALLSLITSVFADEHSEFQTQKWPAWADASMIRVLSEGKAEMPDEHFLSLIEAGTKHFSLKKSQSLVIGTAGDEVVISSGRKVVSCHFHDDESDCHKISFFPPEFQYLLTVETPMAGVSVGGPGHGGLGPVIIITMVTFYAAKKVINKIFFGQFAAPAAVSHFTPAWTDEELAHQIEVLRSEIQQHLSLSLGPSLLSRLGQQAKENHHGHSCSGGCNHDHNLEKHKNDLINIFDIAKGVGIDLYREFLRPVYGAYKFVKHLAQDKRKQEQLSTIAWLKFVQVLGETDALFTGSVILSTVGLKVLVEIAESMVVGPYHIFCTVGDGVVIAAGMIMYSTYHSSRQIIRYLKNGDAHYLQRKSYWKAIAGTLERSLPFKKHNDSLAAFSQYRRQILHKTHKLVESKTHLGTLELSKSKEIALQLGELSKELENLEFDEKLGKNTSIEYENWMRNWKKVYGLLEEQKKPATVISLAKVKAKKTATELKKLSIPDSEERPKHSCENHLIP